MKRWVYGHLVLAAAAAALMGRPAIAAAGRGGKDAARPAAARLTPTAAARAETAASTPADPEATADAILCNVADTVWMRSDHYWHDGDFETTSRMGRLAIRLDPHYVDAGNTLAWLLRQGLSRPEQALAIHHRLVRDNPDDPEACFDLGTYHFDRKEYALAARYLEAAVAHDARQPIHHLLAHAYEKQGLREEALRVWRATLEKFPNDLVARRNLERVEKGQ